MSIIRLPVIVFALVAVAFISDLALIWPALPAQVATHFDVSGNPNRWSSREQLLYMTVFLIAGFGGLIAGVRLLKSAALDSVNLPNRQYWLGPERANKTLDILVAWTRWFLVFVFAFIAAMEITGVHANLHESVQFSMDVLPLAVGFLVCVLVMIGWLFWRFKLPAPETLQPPGQTNSSTL